jgi:aryl-alcohol dehydrogenase-like predicted oxidoreductase
MERRKLGRQGLEVAALGYGCMGLTRTYGPPPSEADAVRVLHRAVELGTDFFDTAEIYGRFENEKLVGRALKPFRDKVVIATKFGFKIPAEPGPATGADSRPEHIREVCDASLQRLGVDVIDLFYQHRVDPNVPIEDVAGAVGELVKAGKVRWFGLSEAGLDTIRRAHRTFPVSALQNEYSLWSREHERAGLPLCRELGIGFVAYSPLGRGFLAGAVKGLESLQTGDARLAHPRFQGEALKHNLSLLQTLERLAAAKGRTPGQLALAWVMHQGQDIVPIPGTSNLGRLEENVAAAGIRLSAAELEEISRAVPATAVEGDRYNASAMAMVGLDTA